MSLIEDGKTRIIKKYTPIYFNSSGYEENKKKFIRYFRKTGRKERGDFVEYWSKGLKITKNNFIGQRLAHSSSSVAKREALQKKWRQR